VKSVAVAAVLILAVVLQTTLSRFVMRGTVAIDLVLVTVVYVSLVGGPVTGLLSGTAAGLVQDALSSGLLGVSGLADTVVGFLAGTVANQLIVTQPLPRFIVFVAASILHDAIAIGLYVLLDLRPFGSPYASVAGRALGNGLAGVVLFQLAEILPGAVERRRAQRARIR